MNKSVPKDVGPFLASQGHCLVCGGPGSGKTTLALTKAVTRIKAGLRPGQTVLFLSFSRAAVGRLVEAGAQAVPFDCRDRLAVQTFHSFFWNVLSCHGYLLGAPHRLQILMPHDERALSRGIKTDDPEWPLWEQKRENLFFREGRIAFDLFAPMTHRLVGQSGIIKSLIAQRYPLIIVDEAQDTGEAAWDFICEIKDATQVVCLADPEQQIFDHLPGVGPQRIEAIRRELRPLEIDLGQENNRSPGTEIALFGNDLLHGAARGRSYAGVSRLVYNPRAGLDLNLLLRKALAIVFRQARSNGVKCESCAILVSTGREVAAITAALSNGAKPVPHRVVFDEATALLASRLAAFILEPKSTTRLNGHVAEALEYLADIESSYGTSGGREAADNYRRWSREYEGGKKIPKRSVAYSLRAMIQALHERGFTGDPSVDWLRVKSAFRESGDRRLAELSGHLDYLVAFGRGRFLAANLHACWMRDGTYAGARVAFDTALAQDAITESSQDASGLHVMTIHRSKAKQFDSVIIVRKSVPDVGGRWRSSFVWRGDVAPYRRSRKILRVAVTRAKKHVLILDPAFPDCPLLTGHSL